MRILASCNVRFGGNDDSFVRAFRRAGHSVLVVPPESYLPRWQTHWLRAVRRMAAPSIVAEYNRSLSEAFTHFEPDLFFVFKGDSVAAATVSAARSAGAVAINFYPDTGFDGYAAQSIASYDWVFTTKPAQIDFLRERYGYEAATFVPHGFDPDIHRPPDMSPFDWKRYGCDVVFIGNVSGKKIAAIQHVSKALPGVSIKVWGAEGWLKAPDNVRRFYQGTSVWGQEYAKAIFGAKINLGLLFEGSTAAPAGDALTARTFEVPAVGGFMLHERTEDVAQYFEDGTDSVFFGDHAELVEKIKHYLAHDEERQRISKAGRERSLRSGYSYDDRVRTIIDRVHTLQQPERQRDA